MIGITGQPPISDPTVTFGGRTYTVVYNVLAEFKCSEWGQDPRTLIAAIFPRPLVPGEPAPTADPRAAYYIFQLFAACVAGNFVGESAPTAEQWALRFGAKMPPGLSEEIGRAVAMAVVKRMRESQSDQGQALPETTPGPSPSAVQ